MGVYIGCGNLRHTASDYFFKRHAKWLSEDLQFNVVDKGKDVYRQMTANGKVEICAMYKGEWIRVCGNVIQDERQEAEESMLSAYPELRKMYTTGANGNTAVFYFEHATAAISSFTHEPEVLTF